MKTIKRYGQLFVILVLVAIVLFLRTGKKIDEGALMGSVYADEKLMEDNQKLKQYNAVLYSRLLSDSIEANTRSEIRNVQALTDTMCEQIIALKALAVNISGGMKEKGNYYTLNNPGMNFGHSNILTGDKGKDNGEGTKLKKNIIQLRSLLIQSFGENDEERKLINDLLCTDGRQEKGSEYIFSWEEQYFKLLTTVGILNLLSVLENNILCSEQIFIQQQLRQ